MRDSRIEAYEGGVVATRVTDYFNLLLTVRVAAGSPQ